MVDAYSYATIGSERFDLDSWNALLDATPAPAFVEGVTPIWETLADIGASALASAWAAAQQPLTERAAELEAALRALQEAEEHYRLSLFQITPTADHLDVGRAWDRMRKASDKARAVLAAAEKP